MEASFLQRENYLCLSICSKSTSGKIMMRMEKRFFLKTPIKFSRLTSRFSNIQHRWKAHKGTDYAKTPNHHCIRNSYKNRIYCGNM
jgi:hypothetical protein